MKKIIAALLLTLTASSYAVTLTQFTVNRSGGGQIDALIANSDEGLEITLMRCNFRPVASGTRAKVEGTETVAAAMAILEGTAILATNLTPVRPGLATGTWASMTYTFNTAQFGDTHPSITITEEVRAPMVIIDGQVSNVLAELESQARKLCKTK